MSANAPMLWELRVPAPRLPAEEAAAGAGLLLAIVCPLLIGFWYQTGIKCEDQWGRGAGTIKPGLCSLTAVWYRIIVTSRPGAGPGGAARVCGVGETGERLRLPAWGDPGPGWRETQARLESRSQEQAGLRLAQSASRVRAAASSRARLDISPDHAISAAVGGDTNPGPRTQRHPEPTSGPWSCSDENCRKMIWINIDTGPLIIINIELKSELYLKWLIFSDLTEDNFINVVSGEEHGQHDGVEPHRVHGPAQHEQHLRSHGQ